MVKIKFIPYNREIEVPKGENLLEAVRKAGIFMDTPCNGSGACGKCKVKKINGNIVSKTADILLKKRKKTDIFLPAKVLSKLIQL